MMKFLFNVASLLPSFEPSTWHDDNYDDSSIKNGCDALNFIIKIIAKRLRIKAKVSEGMKNM